MKNKAFYSPNAIRGLLFWTTFGASTLAANHHLIEIPRQEVARNLDRDEQIRQQMVAISQFGTENTLNEVKDWASQTENQNWVTNSGFNLILTRFLSMSHKDQMSLIRHDNAKGETVSINSLGTVSPISLATLKETEEQILNLGPEAQEELKKTVIDGTTNQQYQSIIRKVDFAKPIFPQISQFTTVNSPNFRYANALELQRLLDSGDTFKRFLNKNRF